MVEARIPVDVSIGEFVPDLALFSRTVRTQRNKRRDTALIACHHARPVGYLFATTKDCWIDEIESRLIVEPREVYLYDAYTHPAYRGKHIYVTLLNRAVDSFWQRGYSHALIFASAHNTGSIKGIEQCGFSEYGTVWRLKLFGRNVWNFRITKKYVASHFENKT
jgi:GNAT superfamily N-acetyltransferase